MRRIKKRPPSLSRPIEKATIPQIKAWLSDQENDTLVRAGNKHRIPTWPITIETLTIALRRVGIDNAEQMLSSVDATLNHLRTHTQVFREWVLVMSDREGGWAQLSPSCNTDVYVWGAESDSLPLTMAVLALCVACYPEPENGFDDGYFFQAPRSAA